MLLLLMLQLVVSPSPDSVWMQGRAALKEARYADAEQFLNRALENAITDHLDDTQVGVLYNDLAETFRRTGRYSEAKSLFEKSLALLRKNTKPGKEMVTVLNNAGVLYFDAGQYMR